MTTRTVSYSRARCWSGPGTSISATPLPTGRAPPAGDGRADRGRPARDRLPPGGAGLGVRQRSPSGRACRRSASGPRRPKFGPLAVPGGVGADTDPRASAGPGKGNAILFPKDVTIRQEKQITLNTNPFCEEQAGKLGLDLKQARCGSASGASARSSTSSSPTGTGCCREPARDEPAQRPPPRRGRAAARAEVHRPRRRRPRRRSSSRATSTSSSSCRRRCRT